MENTHQTLHSLGVETTRNEGLVIPLPNSILPWLPPESEVRASRVVLAGGTELLMASTIGKNPGIRKVADAVPPVHSRSAEQALFKALPIMINGTGELPPNIDIVPRDARGDTDISMYKTTKNIKGAPRLYFTILDHSEGPLVVKLGIAMHKDQMKLQGMFTGRRVTGKHDG